MGYDGMGGGAAVSALLYPLPETHSAVVMADLQAFVKTPAANPPVLVQPYVQDTLNRAHARQERRRYAAEPEVVTAFGSLT